MYLGFPEGLGEPQKLLRGFKESTSACRKLDNGEPRAESTGHLCVVRGGPVAHP